MKEKDKDQNKLTGREKIVLLLVILLVKMIRPWEYDHQFDKFWLEIKELAKGNG